MSSVTTDAGAELLPVGHTHPVWILSQVQALLIILVKYLMMRLQKETSENVIQTCVCLVPSEGYALTALVTEALPRATVPDPSLSSGFSLRPSEASLEA